MPEKKEGITVSIRNMDPDLWWKAKRTAIDRQITLRDMIMGMIEKENLIGDPRSAAIDGVEFRLTPHRIDDSKDDGSVWRWKLTTWAIDDDGLMRPFDSRLL